MKKKSPSALKSAGDLRFACGVQAHAPGRLGQMDGWIRSNPVVTDKCFALDASRCGREDRIDC